MSRNIQGMARALYAGQNRDPQNHGEYHFDVRGQGVWDVNESDNRQTFVPTGEWLGGLAVACGVDMSLSEITDLAYQVGRLVGQNKSYST